MEEGQTDKSEEEGVTESDSNSTESEDSDEEEERQNGREESEDEAGEDENGSIEAENEEEKKDKCKQEPLPTSGRHGQNAVDHLSRNLGNCSERGDLRMTMTDQNLNVTTERPCGNPIVIDEALERILRDDPTMSELNFNNIEDISQETLLRISEALSANTHVRVFSLSNTRANDRVAFAISKMLRDNCSITNLNIESNFVSGQGILALLASLQQNSTLVELRFHNQRHICGGQVEMEMVHLLRDNNTLLKLGYQFDLPGPRMTATSILTRNQDRQRQRRMQQQMEKGHPEATVQPRADAGTTGLVSGSPPSNKPPWFSPKHARNDQTPNNIPPPPPPPPLPGLQSERNTPTRKIAEMIKQHEGSTKSQSGQKKPKSKRGKNGANKKCSSDILKELKNALKPSSRKKKDNPPRPLAPLSSTRDDLMAAIRGSSIRSLKRVTLQQDLC